MPGGNQFTIQDVPIKASTVETATGTMVDVPPSSETARAIEIWLDVTAASGTTPTLDVIVEATIFDRDTGPYVQQAIFSGITAVATQSLALNRADNTLGKFVRIRWVIGGTTPSFTFQVRMGRME